MLLTPEQQAKLTALGKQVSDNQAQQSQLAVQAAKMASEIEQSKKRQDELEAEIATLESELERSREEVAQISRYIYSQPDNILLVIASANSFADAEDQIANYVIAGQRAADLTRQLRSEEQRLQAARKDLAAQQAAQMKEAQQLQAQIAQLQQQRDALLAQISSLPAGTAVQVPADQQAIMALIVETFTPLGPDAVVWALRIGRCESGYNPLAVNTSSGAMGVFQFLPSTWAGSPWHDQSAFDPTANVQAAAWLYHRSGPNQWECK